MKLASFIVDPKDYVLENDQIGEGNFGSVSLVHPKKNKKLKIALKRIKVDLDDHDMQKNFVREISIMASLNHPCLIELIGFAFPFKEDQTFQIYSKYLPNRTLIEVLKEDEHLKDRKKTLTPTRRSIIVYGITSAMCYLHQNKIVHRDLKPENVFLDEEYRPVLSDFGLSRFCNDEMNMTIRVGTPYFMAPEMFGLDEDKVTTKVDVYAFAVTLLSLFTTSYKFSGSQPKSINQLVENIINGKRYIIPDGAPDFYVDLINKCWESDSDNRPSFNKILKMLEKNDKFIFKGSDKDEVHDYIDMIKNYEMSNTSSDSSKSTSHSSNKSSSSFEDTKEFDFA